MMNKMLIFFESITDDDDDGGMISANPEKEQVNSGL